MNARSNPAGTALVVVDVQTCFTTPTGAYDAAQDDDVGAFYARVNDLVIPNIKRLLDAYRGAAQPVYFTEMGSLRADGGDLPHPLRRANAASVARTGRVLIPALDDAHARTDARVAPLEGDVVLRKTTTGTLASSPLAQNLRALGVNQVAVVGIVTDCCVAQTSRELADQDFDVTVIEDACASYIPAHHRAVLEVFQNFYGTVTSTAEALSAGEATHRRIR